MATVEKRPLTAEEQEDRARLVAEWDRYKRDHPGASQAWLAQETGLGTQGVISQYFRGIIPLNVRALLAICARIDADPALVSPRLTRDISRAGDNLDLKGVSPIARALIGAIIRADKSGEPETTFSVMLRMLPDEGEQLARLNP